MATEMDYLERRAPSVPGYTCPNIDEIIKMLEGLRSANDALRDSGKYWHSAADDLAGRLEDAEQKISDLRDEIAELKSELRSLERAAA